MVRGNCSVKLNGELIGESEPVTTLQLSAHLDTYEHILDEFSIAACGTSVSNTVNVDAVDWISFDGTNTLTFTPKDADVTTQSIDVLVTSNNGVLIYSYVIEIEIFGCTVSPK